MSRRQVYAEDCLSNIPSRFTYDRLVRSVRTPAVHFIRIPKYEITACPLSE